MAIEVNCPYNEEIKLQALAEHDSTFNIVTPMPFNKIEDHSYAVSERWAPTQEPVIINHYDDNGNFIYSEQELNDDGTPKYTGRYILSGVGYDFHFPYKQSATGFESEQNNSIGWFNSWGVASGSITYSLGNSWTFNVTSAISGNVTDINDLGKKVSGRCGLNDETEMKICYKVSNNTPSGVFVVGNNNALFDYFIQGPGHEYIKISKKTPPAEGLDVLEQVDETNYWFKIGKIDYPSYLKTIYSSNFESTEKNKQAKKYGTDTYNSISTTDVYFTPSQIEAKFGFDMNDPKSMLYENVKKNELPVSKYEWRIYGVYWYNGERRYMECNKELQENFNAMMSSQQLKMNYQSFRLLITYVTQLSSDIMYDNIEYANIVLVENDTDGKEKGPNNRWIIGDTIYIPITSTNNYIPVKANGAIDLSAGDVITFTTPNVESKPNFLMNNTFFIDFPCYKVYGDTLSNVYQTNFSYNAKDNKTEFDIVVDGLATNDLEISNGKEGWRLLGKRTSYIVPPIYDRKSSYADNYCAHKVDVTNSARDHYPMSTNMPAELSGTLYLRPDGYFGPTDSTKFGNYNNKITLGSRYPMTPNAAVRFITKTIFHVEVDGDHVEHYFTISSNSMTQSKEILVRYNGLLAQTQVEKLSNTIVRSMNGVELQPYMYDATKIKVNYKLIGGKEITLKNDEVILTISDNTGAGKSLIDVKLIDIVNRNIDDFIYSTGLVKNEAEGCYEITIFMAAKCDDATFNGKGFNDSTVLVRFNINQKYQQLYNLRDIDYNVVYITKLPPYLIQGIPFTRTPELEKVLNSDISPENSAARVDYNYGSYADNSFGYKDDVFFTNGSPLYVCVASAFVPTNFNGTISGVECNMYDTWTNARRPVAWESANKGASEYVVLTSGNGMGYMTSTDTYSAKANVNLWTFEQTLDIPSARNKKSTISNRLEISAHLDYTNIDEDLATQTMVTITSTV